MAIRWISAAWQQSLLGFPLDQRVYADFRQQEYPEIGGTPTYTLITSADNQPGSHNLTGGYSSYLLDMPSKMVLDLYFKPTFSYTGGTNQYLFSWYVDATHNLSLYFDVAAHKYTLTWQDGGTARTMLSAAYASDVDFQIRTRITLSLDLTTGTTAGSAMYIQGASVATAWSGNSDVKAHYFPILTIRGQNGTAGNYTVNYARLFSGITATAAEVSQNFSQKLDEEIVWHFNGHAIGHTRCNLSATPASGYGRVRSVSIDKTYESATGNSNPNTAQIVLMSRIGQFADDQYAAFAPASELYNGTSAQKYMQKRTPFEIETWYGGLYELEFAGRVDDNLWTRRSTIEDVSVVTLSLADRLNDLKNAIAPVAYNYENYSLSAPSSQTTSLLHVISRLLTTKKVTNYLGNSSFENATIGNSWLVAGAGATLSKVAGGLIGGNEGDLVYGAATASAYQGVRFTGTKKLWIGQNWNFSIYLKSAGAATGTLKIAGTDPSFADVEFQTTAYNLSGGEGWKKYEVTLPITIPGYSQIACFVTKSNAGTLAMDCAMLIQSGSSVNWFALNSNDGTAGIISADSAMSPGYESMGFDVDEVLITHPWVLINQNDILLTFLQDIRDATAAYYLGMDSCGTLKYRTPFATGYADPAPIATITQPTQVAAIIETNQANHIIIHGTVIMKDTSAQILWNAKNSGSFDTIDGADIYETIANSAYWPAPATYPEYWAKYSWST